jgi:hypothetical protein
MLGINADALDETVRRIDKAFGPGYAKAHPELVAALVQAAAFDRVARVIEARPAIGDLVRKALTELSEVMEELERDEPPTIPMRSRGVGKYRPHVRAGGRADLPLAPLRTD